MEATGALLTQFSYGVKGPFAGLFVGGNYQVSKLVAGLEADWQWSNLIGNNQTLAPLGAGGVFPAGPFTISTTLKDDASIRGRLGVVAFDRCLVFGTGGLAWGIHRRRTRLSVAPRSPPMAAMAPAGPWEAASTTPSAIVSSAALISVHEPWDLGLRERRHQFGCRTRSLADQ